VTLGNIRAVRCVVCGAQPSQPCREWHVRRPAGKQYTPRRSHHLARVRQAQARLRAQRRNGVIG